MRTIRDRGYNRLVPETKLEQGLLAAVIRGAIDGKETRIHDHDHVGTVKVKDEWDDAGRLAVTLLVPTPDDGDDSSLSLLLDAQKQYHFHAWVLDRNGEPVVAWEGPRGPMGPEDHAGVQTNHAPYLPHVAHADLV